MDNFRLPKDGLKLLGAIDRGEQDLAIRLASAIQPFACSNKGFGGPVWRAVVRNKPPLLDKLLELNWPIEAYQKCDPLWYAAREGYYSVAELLLNAGHPAVGLRVDPRLPLEEAVIQQHFELAEMLLRAGGNRPKKNKASRDGLSALVRAVNLDRADAVRWLLANGWTSSADTGLVAAVHEGKDSLLKMLISAGADPNGRCYHHGESHLTHAIAEGHRSTAVALVDLGAKIEFLEPDWAYAESARDKIEALATMQAFVRQREGISVTESFTSAPAKRKPISL